MQQLLTKKPQSKKIVITLGGNFIQIFILGTIFLSLISFVSAQFIDPLPYTSDTIVPEAESLEVKGNVRVDLFSGAAVYSYPISVPPGTNDLAPQINLAYSSQSAIGKPGILGSGWSFTENYIQRIKNETRDFNDTWANITNDQFKLVSEGSSHDLVFFPDEEGVYHTRVRSFFHIRNETGGSNDRDIYWVLKTKDGTQYRFGYYNFSELSSNQHNYTWRWYLDLVNDTYNNQIFYNYSVNPYSNDNGVAYLDRIRYNTDEEREVYFTYEDTDRPDIRSVYDNGNNINISRRLEEVNVFASSSLVSRHVFAYDTNPNFIDDGKTVSFLSNITEFGSDNTTSFPPRKFGYNYLQSNWTHLSTWNLPQCFVKDNDPGGDRGVRFAELNGDGLLDILYGNNQLPGSCPDSVEAWINNGTDWINENSRAPPECFADGHADLGVRVADLNGDGLSDVIRGWIDVEICKKFAWINDAANNITGGWVQNNSWAPPECFVDANKKDLGMRLVDVNGDGFVDIMKGYDDGQDCQNRTWLNKNDETYGGAEREWEREPLWDPPVCFTHANNGDRGVRFADVNGDGLTDILHGNNDGGCNTNAKAWVNNGSGWVQDNTWAPKGNIKTELCFVDSAGKDQGVRLAEINGDGLIDIVKARYSGTTCQNYAYVNNGSGWNLNRTWNLPQLDCFVEENGRDRGRRLADINGDGLTDLLIGKEDASTCNNDTWVNNAGKARLLRNITTEFGGLISIEYMKSTSLNNSGGDNSSDLSFNVWVVANITEDNGINEAHNLTSFYTYDYSGGQYNHSEEEFRGFAFVEETVSTKVINHSFHQGIENKGREFKTGTSDNSSNPYQRTERTWETVDKNNGTFVVQLIEQSEISFDGDSGTSRIENVSYAYDDFGNAIVVFSKGDVVDSGDEKFEYYHYLNNTDVWIVDRVRNFTILGFNNATKFRESFYIYDEQTLGDSPVKGSVTQQEDFLDIGDNPVTKYDYDNLGNLKNDTDAEGHITNYTYGIRDSTSTFVDRSTNAKGYITNFNYSLGSGELVFERDVNDVEKNYTYDIFTIRESTTLAFDTSGQPTQEYEHDFDGINEGKITVKQREESGSAETIDTYKFYDGFGRLIQEKSEAINGRQIVVDTYYDELGRVKEQSNPYFITFFENYNTPDSTINKSMYEYDQLDRVIKVTNPDGTFQNMSYFYWNISIQDENDNIKDYETDSYGNVVKVVEHNDSETYTTIYDYEDSTGELINVTDALGNNLSYTYDSLGRRIEMKDPDLGVWNYSYDNVSNVIGQNDNRNVTITFEYDELNRKTKEVSDDGNIVYVYDLDKNNTLSQIKTTDMNISFAYDDRLRRVKEEKYANGLNLTTSWTYDSSDRITSITLPSGEIINYTYDDQGLLSNVLNILDIIYNERGDFSNVSYNSSLLTNYSYESDTLRLSSIETSNEQDLNYNYDNTGNVVETNDTANNRNFSMAYDDLNRLVITSIIDGVNDNTLSYVYNAIGNMLNVTATGSLDAEFYYDGEQAHAPSRVVYY